MENVDSQVNSFLFDDSYEEPSEEIKDKVKREVSRVATAALADNLEKVEVEYKDEDELLRKYEELKEKTKIEKEEESYKNEITKSYKTMPPIRHLEVVDSDRKFIKKILIKQLIENSDKIDPEKLASIVKHEEEMKKQLDDMLNQFLGKFENFLEDDGELFDLLNSLRLWKIIFKDIMVQS